MKITSIAMMAIVKSMPVNMLCDKYFMVLNSIAKIEFFSELGVKIDKNLMIYLLKCLKSMILCRKNVNSRILNTKKRRVNIEY